MCLGITIASATLLEGEKPLDDIDLQALKYGVEAFFDHALEGSDFDFGLDTQRSVPEMERRVEEEAHPRAMDAFFATVQTPEERARPASPQPVQAEPQEDRIEAIEARIQLHLYQFRESVTALAPLKFEDYKKLLICLVNRVRSRMQLPLLPMIDEDELDTTKDLLAFANMIKVIYQYHDRYFTPGPEHDAFLDMIRRLGEAQALKSKEIRDMENGLHEFVASIRRFINVSNKPRPTPAEMAAEAHDSFNKAAMNLFDVKEDVYKEHLQAMMRSTYKRIQLPWKDDEGAIHPRIVVLFSAIGKLHMYKSQISPEIAKGIDNILSFDVKVREAKKVLERATTVSEKKVRAKELGKAISSVLKASQDLVKEMQVTEGLKMSFSRVMVDMMALTDRDYAEHYRYLCIYYEKVLGIVVPHEKAGRFVGRIAQMGEVMRKAASRKEQIFSDNQDLAEAFQRALHSFDIIDGILKSFTAAPSKEMFEPLKKTLMVYLRSIYRFVKCWRSDQAAKTLLKAETEKRDPVIQITEAPAVAPSATPVAYGIADDIDEAVLEAYSDKAADGPVAKKLKVDHLFNEREIGDMMSRISE